MILEIQLPANAYRLYIESAQITTCRITSIKDTESANFGNEKIIELGFFTRLPSAMERIIREEIAMNQEVVNLRQFLKIYKTLSENITEQFNTINI